MTAKNLFSYLKNTPLWLPSYHVLQTHSDELWIWVFEKYFRLYTVSCHFSGQHNYKLFLHNTNLFISRSNILRHCCAITFFRLKVLRISHSINLLPMGRFPSVYGTAVLALSLWKSKPSCELTFMFLHVSFYLWDLRESHSETNNATCHPSLNSCCSFFLHQQKSFWCFFFLFPGDTKI